MSNASQPNTHATSGEAAAGTSEPAHASPLVCAKCGYALEGHTITQIDARCPECGFMIAASFAIASARMHNPALHPRVRIGVMLLAVASALYAIVWAVGAFGLMQGDVSDFGAKVFGFALVGGVATSCFGSFLIATQSTVMGISAWNKRRLLTCSVLQLCTLTVFIVDFALVAHIRKPGLSALLGIDEHIVQIVLAAFAFILSTIRSPVLLQMFNALSRGRSNIATHLSSRVNPNLLITAWPLSLAMIFLWAIFFHSPLFLIVGCAVGISASIWQTVLWFSTSVSLVESASR